MTWRASFRGETALSHRGPAPAHGPGLSRPKCTRPHPPGDPPGCVRGHTRQGCPAWTPPNPVRLSFAAQGTLRAARRTPGRVPPGHGARSSVVNPLTSGDRPANPPRAPPEPDRGPVEDAGRAATSSGNAAAEDRAGGRRRHPAGVRRSSSPPRARGPASRSSAWDSTRRPPPRPPAPRRAAPTRGRRCAARRWLGLDVFVDDRPDVHRHLEGIVPLRILFGPQRRASAPPPGVLHVVDWSELSSFFSRRLTLPGIG